MKVTLLFKQIICVILLVSFLSPVNSQTLTARPNINLTPNLNGLYEYLPEHYNANPTAKFPLYIMLGGQSQLGNGSSQLSGVLGGWGTGPWQINGGTFPKSFTIGEPDNQETLEFVIIMPQFVLDPVANNSGVADMNALLQYCFDNYRINPNRVYVSGISSGAGLILDYGSRKKEYGEKFAAAVIMSPALIPSQGKADTLAQSNLPLWISVGDQDETMYPLAGEWMDYFANSTPTYDTFPKYSVFPGNHSAAWDPMYFPTYKENGLNMFEWMLSHDRNTVVPVTGFQLNATTKNSEVLLEWKTVSEINNSGFEVQKSADGVNFEKIGLVNAGAQNGAANSYSFTDINPSNGANFYRIKQIDKDGHASYSKIVSVSVNGGNVVNVYPNPTSNTLHIKGTYSGKIKVQIFDAIGKSVQQNILDGGTNLQINVNKLPKGFYTGTIYSSDKRSDFTFVKN